MRKFNTQEFHNRKEEPNMALVIHMPESFTIGDIADVTINGEPKRVAWFSEDVLTIQPARDKETDVTFVREIVSTLCFDGIRTFTCKEIGETTPLVLHDSPFVATLRENAAPCEWANEPWAKNPKFCGKPSRAVSTDFQGKPFPLCEKHLTESGLLTK